MIVVIDSSSLLSLVRYYLPFDTKSLLLNYIEEKIKSNEIIVLDKIYDECKFMSSGIIIDKLTCLTDKRNHTRTTEILPSRKFFNQVENQFVVPLIKKKLSEPEFESRKNTFLESADAKLILYSLKNNKVHSIRTVIVTEESSTSNDNKTFKKIPAICKMLDLETMTLPELLDSYSDIDLHFK